MTNNRLIWGFISLLVLMTIGVSLETSDARSRVAPLALKTTPTPEINDTRDLSKFGMVHYDARPNENTQEVEKRRQIGQKYDNQGWVVKSVEPPAGGVGKITHDAPPPLFPVEESALIVVGSVVAVNTFLSNDKSGVYTEFSIRIHEVLKDANHSKKNTKEVVADREGGVVIYPNGLRILYQNSDIGLPQLGSKYLFFLTKSHGRVNFEILTSYDLDSASPRQVETGRSFEEFANVSKTSFIETVRRKVGGVQNREQ